MDKIKELLKPITSNFETWFGVPSDVAFYIFCALVALLLIVIIVIICAVAKSKKTKNENKELKVEEPVKEEVKVEEIKVEQHHSEQIVVEEKKIVEPAKEEVKVEETKAEEAKVEEAKEVIEPTETEIIDLTPEEEPVKEKKPQKAKKVSETKKEEPQVETKTTRVVFGKYEVFPVNDSYIYRLKASNGEILVVSEIYTSEAGAIQAIDTVKKNAEEGEIQIHQDKHSLWQFKLLAKNKRVIVSSANYQTQARCESAANSFKRFASISPIVTLEEDPDHLMEKITINRIEDKAGGKIVIEKDDEGYEFRLLANNHAILCTSIHFKTRAAIDSAISSCKDAVLKGKLFVTSDKNGICQFKLYAESGRLLVSGEAYKTKSLAINAANSFVSFLNLSIVEQ